MDNQHAVRYPDGMNDPIKDSFGVIILMGVLITILAFFVGISFHWGWNLAG